MLLQSNCVFFCMDHCAVSNCLLNGFSYFVVGIVVFFVMVSDVVTTE